MVFSNLFFLYLFLPVLFILYYGFKNDAYRRIILVLFSLVFYAWGEPVCVFLMIALVLFDYVFGHVIDRADSSKAKKIWLIIAIVVNLSILGIYKYLGFFTETINTVLGVSIPVFSITMPIGISFFTFQTMSYVIDVYRGDTEVQNSFFKLLLYVSFFPQLIAGPIVRYKDIEAQLSDRSVNLRQINDGVFRFALGLGKKVLIADCCDAVVTSLYGLNEVTIVARWIGAVFFTLQLYYDFSGYSDMAIGLGKMFGFRFEENFNYPYIARSVTDFWRRWHISLSTWFRDYVYIPLGGNRVSTPRHIFNLFVTWLCTGIWHGANWTFIVWGLYFFVFLLLEKFLKLDKVFKYVGNLYTLLVVIISWVIFRAESMGAAFLYIAKMFSFDMASFGGEDFLWYLQRFSVILLLGLVFSTPLAKKAKEKLTEKNLDFIWYIVLLLLMLLSVSFMFRSSYNPFIYFNF